MNFIKLTAPNGNPVWINSDSIDRIVKIISTDRQQTDYEKRLIKKSRLDLSGGEMQIVQETPEQIIKLINP